MIILLKSHFHTLQQQIATYLQQMSYLPTSPLPAIYIKQPLIVTKTFLAKQPLEDPLASKAEETEISRNNSQASEEKLCPEMTLVYFANRSNLDPEPALQPWLVGTGAVTGAGRDWSCHWGTPRTSQPTAHLRGVGVSAAAAPDTKTSLLCNHIDTQSPCTISKTIYAHVPWNPSM